MDTRRPLSPEEHQRLERLERTRQNRRGRRNPATMPDRLARTSAFAPRRRNLISDSNFVRVYEVPGYSVVEVRGRELGSQHRDAIYALFRLKRTKVRVDNPAYRKGTFISPSLTHFESRTTWRELLTMMGRTVHVNNLLSILNIFTEIKQVALVIHEGRTLEDMEKIRKARAGRQLADTSGRVESIISVVDWAGAQLDSEVVIQYGLTVFDMIEKAHLVSINADVQFRLGSDHAKTFWPFIDSQPNYNYIDEERLAQLAGRDLWEEGETSATRAQFRKECREAFKDMVQAGGLTDFREEVRGVGRKKTRRYHYMHAAPRQMELELRANPPSSQQAAEK